MNVRDEKKQQWATWREDLTYIVLTATINGGEVLMLILRLRIHIMWLHLEFLSDC